MVAEAVSVCEESAVTVNMAIVVVTLFGAMDMQEQTEDILVAAYRIGSSLSFVIQANWVRTGLGVLLTGFTCPPTG